MAAGASVAQEHAGVGDGQLGAAVLAVFVATHRAAPLVGNELGAVADAQDGHTEVVDAGIDPRGAVDVNRGWATAEDDSGGCPLGELGRRQVVGDDLTEDICLTNPSGNELGVLGAEVDNQDAVEIGRASCRERV